MEQKQRFSLRKYKLGLASVLLGTIFLGGALASSEVAFAAEVGEDTIQTKTDTTDQPTPAETSSQETSVEPTVENKVADTTVAETTAPGANAQTSQVETPAVSPVTAEDRAAETSSTSSTEKNLDNQTPQAADKVTVEPSATLEKDKNYYEASKFDGNKVLELTDVSTTSSQNIDLTSDLDKIKALDSATIYIEFKPKEGQSGTYSLFSASSATNNRSYYAVGVTNGSTPFVGAPNQGSQLYGGELKSGTIDPTTWNSIAVSINRTNADGAGRIDVYFNGKSAFYSSRAGKFLKDFTDLTNMQLGLMNNGGRNIWGGNVDYRNFTIYNKALTAAEVAERSQIFSRDAVTPDAVDEDGRLLTARDAVFVRSQLPRGTFRIPALVKMQDGSLVAGADQRNTGQADYGDIEMTVRTSDDNGKTWGNKVTIFNPQNNPSAKSQSDQPTVIDIALADGNNGKLYAMYDLFPEGRGMGTLPSQAVAAYKEINGVRYQIITKGSEEYTIRENGKVYDAAGKETNYSVVVDAKDKDHAYQDYGDIYEGSKKIGNILFKTGNKDGFQAINTSYLMLSESSDNGKTWSAPRNISDMVRTDDMIFQGTGPGAGITLKNGDHAGRIIFPTYTTGLGRGGEHASLVYSDDQGKTWHTSDMIFPSSNNSETSIVELQNGALKAFMRTGGKVQEATSLDGGTTWINQKTTDRDSIRTQISAVTTIQDGKEYVLLSTPGASRRIDGFISVGEVQADNSIKWVKQRQIETGIYAYSSIADLGNGEFGILYEHGGRDAGYPEDIYYRKLNWKFLMEDPVISQVNATQSTLTNQTDVIALSYSDGVVASEDLVLKLSNGRTLPFIGQKDGKTLLFKWDKEADQGATVVGVETGSLDSLNNYKLDPTASLPYTLEPKESTETLPFDTYYKGDENLDYGSERVEAGKAGQKVTTTTYTLDATGKVIEKVTTVVTNPVAQAIVKGTKPTTTSQETALPTRYEADEDFAYGERNEVAGSPKVEMTTTTYEVDATTGAITPMTTTTTTNPGRATVVFVGTKPTTQETEIASPVRYEAKDDKDFGSANETVSGETGVSVVKTTYTVNPTTGEVTARAGAPVVTKPATATVIYVGTKPTVTTESVSFGTDYVADESLAYGQSSETAGVAGTKTITTTYKLEGDKAVVADTTEQVTTVAQNRLVKIGTKPSVETKELDFAIEYVADETAVVNAQTVTTPGVKGSETTTTTYKLDGDHAVVDQTTTATKKPINQVISVGTKPTVTTESVPFSTDYLAAADLAFGERRETAGQNGVETTTTTYKLENGRAVQDKVTTVQSQAPVNKQVKIGNVKVETITTNPETVYEADSSLAYGVTAVASEGKAGQTLTTTTYQVDTSGNLVNGVETVTTTPAENRVIRIGNIQTSTSPIALETVYEDDPDNFTTSEIVVTAGQAGEKTTTLTYQVNPATGALTNPVTSSVTSKEMVKRVIKRGTLAVVAATENELPAVEETTSTESVDLPFTTRYEADETLDYGVREVRVSGQAGKQTTTRHTATLNGEVVAQREEVTSTTPAVEEVIVLGTKPKTETVSIASPVRYEADADKEFGSVNEIVPGQVGESTITTTYAVDAATGLVTVHKGETLVTKEPTETVVKVGTKPTVTTESSPFGTDYVADESLAYGEQSETAGVAGEKTVTTSYTVNLTTGEVTATAGDPVQTKAPVTKVVKIGMKPTITTTDVDYTTSYVADDTLDYGKTAVRTPGVKGQATTTTTYKLDGDKAVVDNTTTTPTMAPTAEVIAVGTKATTTTADVDYTTSYVADDMLDYGKTTIRTPGVKGQVTTTTTYKLDGDHAVVDKVDTQTTTPTVQVISVGTKPTVQETEIASPVRYEAKADKDFGSANETVSGETGVSTVTTKYTVNPTTGEVTATVGEALVTKEPTETIVKVGTKSTVTTESVPFATEYKADSNLLYGEQSETAGVAGEKTIKTTYKLAGDKAVVDATSEEVTTLAQNRVIKVGTKPTVTTEVVPFATEYKADSNLPYGEHSETAGVEGEKIIKTTYKLAGDKAVVDATHEEVTISARNRVIRVGNVQRATAPITIETVYEEDPANFTTSEIVVTEGQAGESSITTTYAINPRTGALESPQSQTSIVQEMKPRVIKRGTLAEVAATENELPAVEETSREEVTETPYTTTYQADESLEHGQTRVVTAGQVGKRVVTLHQARVNGELVAEKAETTQEMPVISALITVGTKPSVVLEDIASPVRYEADENLEHGEQVTLPGRPGQRAITTTYTVDPRTGAVTATAGTPVEIAPTATIVKVGTKPSVTTEPVPFGTDYVADSSLPYGEQSETAGVAGTKTITITYKLEGDKAIVDDTTEQITTAAQNRLVKIGTKPSTVSKELDFATEYVADEPAEANTQTVTTPGVKGSETTTTTYKLDGDHAVVDQTTTATKKPTNQVISVGTKPTVTTEPVPFSTDYVADEYLPYGEHSETAGVAGEKTIKTTYKLDGDKAVVDATNEQVTTASQNRLVKVGTKPTVTTESVPFSTDYVADDSLPYGATSETAGVAGVKTITTTYKLEGDKAVVADTTEQVTTAAQNRLVKIGTKPSTVSKELDFATEYVADETAEVNTQTVTTPGVKGSETTTTTYKLEGDHAVVDKVDTQTTNPTAQVISVGTKPTVQETEIASPVRYETKADKDFGSANETVSGETGVSTIKTTYTVNPTTGEVTATVSDPVITKPAMATVIYVGTKPTVTTASVPFSTDYVADESLPYGEQSETAGVAGEKTITTTYKLEGDKAVVADTTEQVTTAAQNRLVKIGTKPSVETKELDFATEYLADDTAEVNTQTVTTPGVKGSETTTTTYKLDGDHAVVDQTTTATKEPINQVIKVGTKPTVTTESVPFSTDYVADENLPYGEQSETAGVAGEKTITTTYKLDGDKAVVADTTEQVTTAVKKRVIRIGNITTNRQVVPMATRTIADPNLEFGQTRVVTEGQDGVLLLTTRYQVNPKTGALEHPALSSSEEVSMIERVVAVGTKSAVQPSPVQPDKEKENPEQPLPKPIVLPTNTKNQNEKSVTPQDGAEKVSPNSVTSSGAAETHRQLPNTGDNREQASQVALVGAGILGVLGLASLKKGKKED